MTPPSRQLTRPQRRQLQKLADRVDRVTQADRLFFERRPDRQRRVRLANQAELSSRKSLPANRWRPSGRARSGAVVSRRRGNMTMTRRFSDRAAVVAIAIRQIVANTLNPDEQQLRIEQLLRDEIVDIERQVTADRHA